MILHRRIVRLATALAIAAISASLPVAAQQGQPLSILPPGGAKPQPGKPSAKPAPGTATPTAPVVMDRDTVVAKANAYFNGITSLQGEFRQTAGDGRRTQGRIYLLKPGRLRFEYDAPSTIEVIADGKSVAVRDRRLNTQDLYSLGQTPLKFLVRDRVDLARDTKILTTAADGDNVVLTIEDKQTLAGTSRIKLVFDAANFTLREWTVRDPQGQETNVRLANLDTAKRPADRLFAINYERLLEDRK